jgi:hypothetical protein
MAPSPVLRNHVALYQERAWQKSRRAPARAGRSSQCVLLKTLMGTSNPGQSGGERVNVLGLSRWQFGVTTARYFVFVPIDVEIGLPVPGFETART